MTYKIYPINLLTDSAEDPCGIAAALHAVGYTGYLSGEVFKSSSDVEVGARNALEFLREILKQKNR